MDFNVHEILEEACRGGREITPAALAIAIRAAAQQCIDDRGNVSTGLLYELTCQLERAHIDL